MTSIPDSVKATLWSYDMSKIDLIKDKNLIINHVLNFGTSSATDWLFNNYSKDDIIPLIQNPIPGFWNKKSLNLWAIVFGVKPVLTKRTFDGHKKDPLEPVVGNSLHEQPSCWRGQ